MTIVLDASALLAYLQNESRHEQVDAVLTEASMSSVNREKYRRTIPHVLKVPAPESSITCLITTDKHEYEAAIAT